MASEEHQLSSKHEKYNVVGIKDLPVAERPRERLLLVGAASLSLSEIISIILGQGTPQKPVMELSNQIIAKFGNLNEIGKASIEKFLSIDGIGIAKASRLYACLELSRRFSGGNFVKSKQYTNPKIVYSLLKPYFLHKEKEMFIVVSLGARRQLIAVDIVSIGTVSESLVHAREVFKTAINRGASAIFIAHNHPSGGLEASNEDIVITKRLVKTSYTIGIPIIDHLIVSDVGYLSMKQEGLF